MIGSVREMYLQRNSPNVAAQIPSPVQRTSADGYKYSFNRVSLRPSNFQDDPQRPLQFQGIPGYFTVNAQTIRAAIKCLEGVEIPHFALKKGNLSSRNIGRI